MNIDPPRSIWMHPHDEIQLQGNSPGYSDKNRPAGSTKLQNEKKGFVAKLKDKIIGALDEEREAEKRAQEAKEQASI